MEGWTAWSLNAATSSNALGSCGTDAHYPAHCNGGGIEDGAVRLVPVKG